MRIVKKQHIDDYGTDITPDLREVLDGIDLAARLLINPRIITHYERNDILEIVNGARNSLAKILEVE